MPRRYIVASTDQQRNTVRHHALQHRDLALPPPACGIVRVVVNRRLAEERCGTWHIPPEKWRPVLVLARARPLAEGRAVKLQRGARHELVPCRVRDKHVDRAVVPARVGLQLAQCGITLGRKLQCCTAHKLGQGGLARAGLEKRRVHLGTVAGDRQIGGIDACPDRRALALPVNFHGVACLRLNPACRWVEE